MKTKSIDELMAHAKLGFSEAVMDKLSLEAEEEKRRKLAQLAEDHELPAGLTGDMEAIFGGRDVAASPGSGEVTAPATPTTLSAALAKPTPVSGKEAEEKEEPAAQLARAREIFVTNLTRQYLKFVVRPAADDDGKVWEDEIAGLIEGFFGIARGGTSCHAWIMDPAADSEPALQAGEGVWAKNPPVNKPLSDAFFRAAGRLSVSPQLRDTSFVTMSFAPLLAEHMTTSITKTLGGEFFDSMQADHLVIVYKEPKKGRGQRRCRSHLVDRCLAYVSKTASAAIEEANSKGRTRLALTSTSTMSDAILNAARRGDTPDIDGSAVSLRMKRDILSENGMLKLEQQEVESSPESMAILFHQEKPQSLWREILHHYHVSTLCTATPGCGDLLLAAFDLGVPSVALCKNEAHVSFLQTRLAKHISTSTMNEASTHYQSDFALAKSCELSERVLASTTKTSKEEAEPADEGTEGEDGEEEEEGEEDEEGEEEEEAEEEDAEEEVEIKKAPARKTKKEVEAKASKAKSKAKAKNEPKAKAKAKAKAYEEEEVDDDDEFLAPPPPQKAKGKAKAKAAATKVPEAKKKKAAADGQSPTKRGADEAGAEMTPRTKRNRREVGGGAPLEKLMMLRARLGVSTGALSSLPRL